MCKKLFIYFSVFCFFTNSLFGQSAKDAFIIKFPVLQKKFTDIQSSGKVSENEILFLRNEYSKLKNAQSDILEFSGNKKIFTFFSETELKQLSDKNELKNLNTIISKQKTDISELLSTKTAFGADSFECANFIAIFNENMKLKNYSLAYKYWTVLFHQYPMSNKTIYSLGNTLVNNYISTTTEKNQKNAWIDTLFLIYDQRMLYFSNDTKYGKGYISGRKALDLIKYKPENSSEIFSLLKTSAEMQKTECEEAVLLAFVQYSNIECENKNSSQFQFLENYWLTFNLLIHKQQNTENLLQIETNENAAKQLKKDKENIFKALKGIDKQFIANNINCDTINVFFAQRVKQNHLDSVRIFKITTLLDQKKCNKDTIYIYLLEKIEKEAPSTLVFEKIANYYFDIAEFNKAEIYFGKALLTELNDTIKQTLKYNLAVSQYRQKKAQDAAKNCKELISINPKNSNALFLLGYLYAEYGEDCAANDFEKAAIYWIAVDQFEKAKKANANAKKDADAMIKKYSAYFPSREAAFMHNILPNSVFSIGCWINEKTTARFLK